MMVLLFSLIGGIVLLLVYLKPFRPSISINRNPELNVLLITLDTTRADRLSCYGYTRARTPRLDELASLGIRFANAYSPVPLTLPAHTSIMTGLYPFAHGVRNNGFYYLQPEFKTLAEILKERGLTTAAFVSSFTVDSRFGLDQGFELYDDNFQPEKVIKNFASERRAEAVFEAFQKWLKNYQGEHFFCWVHFFDPHLPYDPPSPFKEELAGRPYDGEIAYMDHYVGRVIDELREKGLAKNTLVVIVGDHGEALGQKNEVDHGLFIYDLTLRVPFIMVAPGVLPSGRVVETRVQLVDIFPTICDLLGIRVEDSQIPLAGRSLLPSISGRRTKDPDVYIESYQPREYYGWSELVGLISGDWKYIQAPHPELYNLKEDPAEELNLYPEKKEIAAELEARLAQMIASGTELAGKGRRELSSTEIRRLQSLGYLTPGQVHASETKQLPDPKDKIKEYALFALAKKYQYEGDYEKAAENLKTLLSLNPDSPWHYVNLAHLYEKMDRLEEGLRLLEEGRRLHPDSIVILARLALFYMKAMKPAQALETCQAVLEIDPHYFDTLYIAAVALVNLERWSEALAYFEKALAIEPENKPLRLRYAYCLVALNRGREALDIYRQLKQEYPQDPVVYRELGILYDTLGELAKARENFRKCVELSPSPNSYFNYAVVLEKSGQLKEAVYYLKLYLETTREGNTPRRRKAEQALAQWEARLK